MNQRKFSLWLDEFARTETGYEFLSFLFNCDAFLGTEGLDEIMSANENLNRLWEDAIPKGKIVFMAGRRQEPFFGPDFCIYISPDDEDFI